MPSTTRRSLALFALLGVMAMLWIIGTPPSAGPDEPSHVIRGAALARGELEGEKDAGARVAFILPAHVAFPDPGCYAFQPDVAATCATSLPTPDGDARLITSATTYPIWGHLAPGVGSLFPGDISPFTVRLFDVLVPLLLVGGSLIAASRRGPLASGSFLVALTVPAWFAMIVVNPSGYVIAGGLAVWTAFLGTEVAPSRLERWLFVAGWASMVLPRRDGLIYAAVILSAVLLVTSAGLGDRWRQLGRPGQVVVAGSTLATMAWAVTSDQQSSKLLLVVPALPLAAVVIRRLWSARATTPVQKSIFAVGLAIAGLGVSFVLMSRRTTGFQSDVLQAIIRQTGIDLTEAIGRVGWLDTPLPETATFAWLVTLGVLVGAGVMVGDRRRVLGAVAVVAVAVWISWVLTMAQNDPSGLYWQGRYYLPVLVGAPLMLGRVHLDATMARRVGRTVSASALIIMTVAFGAAMRRWAVGTNGSMMPWRWDTYDTLIPPILLLWFHMLVAFGVWWWLEQSTRDAEAAATGPSGVNVVGYHHVASGLGHIARQLVISLRAAGVPIRVIDVAATTSPQLRDPEPPNDELFDTTVAVVTAPQLAGVLDDLPAIREASERTIGYFFWELADVPDEHLYGAGLVDEIWTPTTFVADAYRTAVPATPVRVVPTRLAEPVIDAGIREIWRQRLAPHDEFVFLVSLDLLSVVERKHPLGAIDAFTRAFPDPTTAVRLVVKTVNGDQRPDDLEHLRSAAGHDDRIDVVDEFVSDADIDAMVAAADCLVSLHRGEGLGLAMAAAMWSGAVVLATDYSGNVDFMSNDSAELVGFGLVPVVNGQGAYSEHALWADPDIDAAAAAMQRLVADPVHRQGLARAARLRMSSQASVATFGQATRAALQVGATHDVAVAPDFNETLHALRGRALSAMPAGAKHLVSVGCAGRWYFDWVAEQYGPIDLHTGVEFYSPEPDDLPVNVRWVANTAGNLASIGDDEADLVFSGQNIEHLWPVDVVGFLTETNRVLRPGGTMVIDSPNRAIAAALGWSQPEHTVEFTVDEAVELVVLAGFAVSSVEGLWNCRDQDGGLLALLPADGAEVVARSRAANPADAFVWWIEARRVGQPDVAELTRRVDEIFAAAWPERCERWQFDPAVVSLGPHGSLVTAPAGGEHTLFSGPSMPLTAGAYTATFHVRVPGPAVPAPVGRCEVSIGGRVVAERPIVGVGQRMTPIEVPFNLAEQAFDVQFRVISSGGVTVVAELGARLEPPRPAGV